MSDDIHSGQRGISRSTRLAISLIVLGLVGMCLCLFQRNGGIPPTQHAGELGMASMAPQELMNHWDQLIAKTLGPYVAVVAEADIRKAGQPSEGSGRVRVFSRSDKGWSVSDYLVGINEHTGVKAMPVPAEWPTPRVHDVLAAIPECTGVLEVEDDGQTVRGSVWDGKQPVPIPIGSRAAAAAEWSLEAQVFYGRLRLGGDDPTASIEYLREANQPGHIGVLIHAFGHPAQSWERRVDYEVWCDRQYGYVPQYICIRRYAVDAKTLELETITQVLGFARTSWDQWYPQRWETTYRNIRPQGAELESKVDVSLNLQAEGQLPLSAWQLRARKASSRQRDATTSETNGK